MNRLKKLNKFLPKEQRKINFKRLNFFLKPFVNFINWFNSLTPLKVSLIIFTVLVLFLSITNYFTKPKVIANSENVMQHIYKQEYYVNSICILILGLAVRQFVVLNWLRYRKRPPAALS